MDTTHGIYRHDCVQLQLAKGIDIGPVVNLMRGQLVFPAMPRQEEYFLASTRLVNLQASRGPANRGIQWPFLTQLTKLGTVIQATATDYP